MADTDALLRAYDAQVNEIRRKVTKFGSDLWKSLPDYRDESIDKLVSAIVPRVQAGQIQTAQLTNAYLVQYAKELGIAIESVAVDSNLVTATRGVDPKTVYQRPGTTVYMELASGKSVAQAVDSGEIRLLQLIGGDLQMAKRNQSKATLSKSGVETYRRVLTGRENCALCTIASTQRYWVKDLLPIHPGCDCNVAPLPSGSEFPQVIDDETLDNAHSAIAKQLGISDRSGRAPDYRKIGVTMNDDGTLEVDGSALIKVREHGEYGPVLTWKDQKFTGPNDLD